MNNGITDKTMRAAIQGDVRAFEKIVTAYEKPLFSFIYKMVRTREDSADLTQETFVKVYLHISDYDPSRPFSTWIFSIAKYTTYDWLRKKQKRQGTLYIIDKTDSPYVPEYKSGKEFEMIANKMDISQALEKLQPHYRRVLSLFYFEEYSYKQIAQQLDKPINTIKTLLYRAKRALRRELQQK